MRSHVLVPKDVLNAVAGRLLKIESAKKHFPNQPIVMLDACGCMGPLPDCPCAVKRRLIEQFLELVEKETK